MLDPFSLSLPKPLLAPVIKIANTLDLPALPLHAHEVILAVAFYSFVAQVASPYLSSRLFPKTYPQFNRRTKLGWDVHVVSLVQSLIVNGLSLYIILYDEERKTWRSDEDWEKRIWGYTGFTGFTQSVALGYFLWDLYISARYVNVFGAGLLLHAVCTCTMFIVGYRPFVYFYCPVFLLHELSSPFLNIHWFCDKTGLTGSIYQAINGAMLTITFFGCRLVWGTYGSIAVFRDVYRACTTGYTTPQYFQDKIADLPYAGDINHPNGQTTAFMTMRYLPLWLGASYLVSNVALTMLNFFWFSKMIQTIRKRFDPPLGTRGVGDDQVHYEPQEKATSNDSKKMR